ncbi:MAG: SufD family Fe-S cluster assembly protein [Xanthomonadaceae bacterium]|nr:SufD family Fe-S cluster assembly protein [Xanthomonadaceae bacterium]
MSALMEKLVPDTQAPDDGGFGLARRKALKVLMQHGFPQRKTEHWKYTPLALLEKRALQGPIAQQGERPPAPPALPFATGLVHLHNGVLDPDRSDLPSGVTLVAMLPEDIHFSELDDSGPAHAFAWLNIARFAEAWRIGVEPGLECRLAVVMSFDDGFSGVVHPRLKLELGEAATVTLVESQQGRGEGLCNRVFDIELATRSRLTHGIERASAGAAMIDRTVIDVGRDADYRAYVLDGGGPLTRQDLIVNLGHANAHGSICGVAILHDRSLVDYHTAIEHRVGPSTSAEDFRILADDQAVGVFNGRIHILPGADDSHSTMNTGNLLLSENARINTKPELEIHAEDVTASHGATIGQLDDLARFYLRSRGLDDNQAISLLKYGFAAAVFDELPEGDLRDWMIEQLRKRL